MCDSGHISRSKASGNVSGLFLEGKVMGVLRHHVAGQEFGSTDRTGSIFNPATGAIVGEVAYASAAEADAVIAAAKAAGAAWA